MEIRYSILRFQVWFVSTQSVLTPLNVHLTDDPMADSPQKDDQTQSDLKTNDGK